MISVNNKVLVSCNLNQKDTVKIGNSEFKMALKYETNYRLKSPVVATVLEGNELLNKGDIIICHHNLFYEPSPYFLYGNVFSIPFSKVIFAKVLENGDLLPICGNILGEKVSRETLLPVPPDEREFHKDRLLITNSGYTKYKNGQLVFTRPSAPYSIDYIIDGVQKVAVKISEDMITAVMK